MTDPSAHYDIDQDSFDRLVEDGFLTPLGTPRCQVTRGRYGNGQCPHSGDRVAVTDGFAFPQLTIWVCEGHASELVSTPGWGVRL